MKRKANPSALMFPLRTLSLGSHLGTDSSRLNLGCGIRGRNGGNGSVRTLGNEGGAGGDRLSRSDGSSGEGGSRDRSKEGRGGGDTSREGSCGMPKSA